MTESGRPGGDAEEVREDPPAGGADGDFEGDPALTVARLVMVFAPLALAVIVYLVLRAGSG